jgi:type VI secretion system protein ImpA
MDSSRFAEWLLACSPESPCGEALDYDPEFLALEVLLLGKPEQQYGDTIIPAEKPDWRAVRSAATQLLTRSKDVRIATALARSLTALEGTSGYAKGVGIVASLLNNHWDQTFPLIEQDGEADPIVRSNALAALSDSPSILAALRDSALASANGVAITVREAESVLSPSDAVPTAMTRDQLQNLLIDQWNRDPDPLSAIEFADEQLETIVWLCNNHMSAQEVPNLSAASRLLKLLSSATTAARALATPSENFASSEPSGREVQPNAGVPGVTTKLANRADAIRALEAVCEYFEQHEPSSPVPIFLNRAKKLTGMRFIDIIREVSPESMGTIEVIAGTAKNG